MQTYISLKAIEGFAFYNSSKVAGASQEHKHLQVVSYEHFNTPFLSYLINIFSAKVNENIEYLKIQISVFEKYAYSAYCFREFRCNDNIEDYSKYL